MLLAEVGLEVGGLEVDLLLDKGADLGRWVLVGLWLVSFSAKLSPLTTDISLEWWLSERGGKMVSNSLNSTNSNLPPLSINTFSLFEIRWPLISTVSFSDVTSGFSSSGL